MFDQWAPGKIQNEVAVGASLLANLFTSKHPVREQARSYRTMPLIGGNIRGQGRSYSKKITNPIVTE
jgi:hypothetical protein